jgi:hypothetical protein
LGQPKRQGHAPVTRQQLADHRNRMTFNVFKEQRRTVRPLIVNLTNRSELVLRIDFNLDFLQLVLFLQNL